MRKCNCEQAQEQRKRIEELEVALRGLYRDNIDYLTVNKLGGYDNLWLATARRALHEG